MNLSPIEKEKRKVMLNIARHIAWVLFVGFGAMALSFHSGIPYVPLAVGAILIIMFGSACINHMDDPIDSVIEDE